MNNEEPVDPVVPALLEAHKNVIALQMDRNYFPSNLAYIAAHHPGDRGTERDWQIFLLGVENGAAASYEMLTPPLCASDTAMGQSLKALERALALSEDMELTALEHMLDARNVLAKHCAKCWEVFDRNIVDWVSSVLGLRMETLMEVEISETAALALGARFVQYLNEGDYHPFFIWLTARGEQPGEHNDVTLQDVRRLLGRVSVPPAALLRDVIGKNPLRRSVREYLDWAKKEHARVVFEIREYSKDAPVPTPAIAKWVADNVLMDGGQDNG